MHQSLAPPARNPFDRSFLYLDGPTDARGIYVAFTRGRATNEAFVVLRGEETPADVIAKALTRSWADGPAIAHRAPQGDEAGDEPGNNPAPDDSRLAEVTATKRRLDALQSRERDAPGLGL